jgi:hypothetical protein
MVVVEPEQIVSLEPPENPKLGNAFTVTVAVAILSQPYEFVTVTV